MRGIVKVATVLAGLAVLAACESGADNVLSVEAKGAIYSWVYVDRDGDGKVTQGVDGPVSGARVVLLRGPGDTIASAQSDASGVARITEVPVGRYEIAVDPGILGDSLEAVRIDSTRITVVAQDTGVAMVGLGYPSTTLAQARTLAQGRRVTVDVVALHASGAFGDSTLHVSDSTGALRLVQMPARSAVTGDSLRVVGRVSQRHGLPVIAEAQFFTLGKGTVPDPRELSTAAAATAEGRTLDAALVRVREARILEASQTVNGDIRVRVDDGSGELEILLDRDARITTEVPLARGVIIDATGVLTPTSRDSEWQLKPRSSADFSGRVPEFTIAEARSLAPGTFVAVRGITLNNWATFSDRSVHLADPDAAIRAVNVPSSFIMAGDSVRLQGMIAISGGQPVLFSPTSTLLRKSNVPSPRLVSTATAASANEGRLDAALVEVRGATIEAVAISSGGTVVVLNDGSGELVVLIDPNTGIGTTGLTKGAVLDVIGLLVPFSDGTRWTLRPRSPADVVRR